MSAFVDNGTMKNVIYLDFSKASAMVFHSILVSKLGHYVLDGWTNKQIKKKKKKCLEEARRVMVNGLQPNGSEYHGGLFWALCSLMSLSSLTSLQVQVWCSSHQIKGTNWYTGVCHSGGPRHAGGTSRQEPCESQRARRWSQASQWCMAAGETIDIN